MNSELNSATVKQLEQIARAIRGLEGLPVNYRLASKLCVVLEEIVALCVPPLGREKP